MMRQLLTKKQKLDIVLQSSLYYVHPWFISADIEIEIFPKEDIPLCPQICFIIEENIRKKKKLWFQWLYWMCWWRWNRNSNETRWLSRFKLPKCGKRHALSISCWHTWDSVPKEENKNFLEDLFWRNQVPMCTFAKVLEKNFRKMCRKKTSLPSKGKARGWI